VTINRRSRFKFAGAIRMMATAPRTRGQLCRSHSQGRAPSTQNNVICNKHCSLHEQFSALENIGLRFGVAARGVCYKIGAGSPPSVEPGPDLDPIPR
jgi:hypothetical protein